MTLAVQEKSHVRPCLGHGFGMLLSEKRPKYPYYSNVAQRASKQIMFHESSGKSINSKFW